jgi:hypothetical protein
MRTVHYYGDGQDCIYILYRIALRSTYSVKRVCDDKVGWFWIEL